jgi:hypothetical protein
VTTFDDTAADVIDALDVTTSTTADNADDANNARQCTDDKAKAKSDI